jgi:hypothetical protein
MTTTLANPTQRRELARRASGGIEIALYWTPDDNSTSVEIWLATTEETISFTVAPEQALDAFHHPFAHLLAAPND